MCLQGQCVHLANANTCEDGDPCTTGDTCSNKVCQPGPPKACPVNELCQPGTGACACAPDAVRCSGACKLPSERECIPGNLQVDIDACGGSRACQASCEWAYSCTSTLYCHNQVYWRCFENNCYSEGGSC
ncbi:MAG: hypothetical protein IT376_00290 [Polyangiaceae bacterium]|nr:hypothetical protein [Polyangiaceae bacterium]